MELIKRVNVEELLPPDHPYLTKDLVGVLFEGISLGTAATVDEVLSIDLAAETVLRWCNNMAHIIGAKNIGFAGLTAGDVKDSVRHTDSKTVYLRLGYLYKKAEDLKGNTLKCIAHGLTDLVYITAESTYNETAMQRYVPGLGDKPAAYVKVYLGLCRHLYEAMIMENVKGQYPGMGYVLNRAGKLVLATRVEILKSVLARLADHDEKAAVSAIMMYILSSLILDYEPDMPEGVNESMWNACLEKSCELLIAYCPEIPKGTKQIASIADNMAQFFPDSAMEVLDTLSAADDLEREAIRSARSAKAPSGEPVIEEVEDDEDGDDGDEADRSRGAKADKLEKAAGVEHEPTDAESTAVKNEEFLRGASSFVEEEVKEIHEEADSGALTDKTEAKMFEVAKSRKLDLQPPSVFREVNRLPIKWHIPNTRSLNDFQAREEYAKIARKNHELIRDLERHLFTKHVIFDDERRGLSFGQLDQDKLVEALAGDPFVHVMRREVVKEKTVVVILIDMSGSMGSVERESSDAFKALNACVAVLEVIKKIPTATAFVYGHTADLGGINGATDMYAFVEGGTTHTDMSKVVFATGVYENRDGRAIDAVVERVRQQVDESQHVIMFQISDGHPCAYGYGWDVGAAHTIDAMDRAERDANFTCIHVATNSSAALPGVKSVVFDKDFATNFAKEVSAKLESSVFAGYR